jgi:hypothetical protein
VEGHEDYIYCSPPQPKLSEADAGWAKSLASAILPGD